jgi:hypothetical protein
MPLILNGDGSVGPLSAVEVGYLDGVTSAVQTQFTGKANASTNGVWASYTPTLTTSGTSPTLGTGSFVSGNYVQFGKLVICRFYIAFGSSGAAAGSGTYRVSLPVSSNQMTQPSGTIFMYDSSAGNGVANAAAFYDGGADFLTIIYAASATTYASVTHAAPWAWAASDQIRGFIMYEAA